VVRDALAAGRRRRPAGSLVLSVRAAAAAALLCTLLGGAAVAVGARWLGRAERVAAAGPSAPAVVRFELAAPAAGRVSLVGDFNGWDPAAMPLRRVRQGGAWVVEVPLPPGRHAYAFMVDGALVVDPAAPRAADEDFGVPSSVVLVRGSES